MNNSLRFSQEAKTVLFLGAKRIVCCWICIIGLGESVVAQQTGANDLSSIISQSARYFANLHSIEYTVIQGDEKGKYFSKAHWKEMGDKYWIDYENADRKSKTDFKLLMSYDGDHGYNYLSDEDVIQIQKARFPNDKLISEFIFPGPFRPFQFLVQADTRPGADGMIEETTLKSAVERASLHPEKNKSWYGHPCIAVKISNGYDLRTYTNVDYVVFFATDCSFYPIAWDMFDKKGNFMEGISVKEFKSISIKNATGELSLRYPGIVVQRSGLTIKNGKVVQRDLGDIPDDKEGSEIKYPEIQVNHLEKSDFTLDPAMASHINDLDNGLNIVVPK